MKRLFALIFALVICLTAFTACGGQPSEAVQETTEKAKLTDEVTRIKTPYAEICVPKSFENNVKNTVTKESPYTVAFTSVKDDTQLFEVVFNGKGSVLMGTIVGDEGNTVLYMNVPALKKDSPNFNENLAYGRKLKSRRKELLEFIFVIGKSATRSAECECGTKHNRKADVFHCFSAFFHGGCNFRRKNRFSEFFTKLFK